MEKTLLRIIKYGTFLILLTPLIFNDKLFFPFVAPKTLYFFALTQIIFFSYLILILSSPGYRPRLNLLLIILGVFLIILTLSSVFGVDFQESFWSKYERMTGLLMWLHLFVFFVVASSVFKKKEDWFKVFGVSVLVATLISLLSIFEKMGIEVVGATGRGGVTLGNPSFLGTYLLFNFFFALYLFFKTNVRKYQSAFYKYFNFCALLGAGLIGLALWFSTARAALLSTIGGLVLLGFLWLAFCQKGRIKYVGFSLIALAVLAGIALVFFIFYSPTLVEDKLVDQFGSSTIVPRFAVYRIGWTGFLERPWLGWGPETFGLVFTRHFNPQFFFSEKFGNDVWYDRSHNIIFDTLAMTGILGLLGYLAIFAGVFYVLWRGFFSKRIDFWIAGIFSVVLIAYFVQNLTVFDMVSSYLMFFLVLAFVGALTSSKSETKEAKSVRPKLWLVSIVLVLAAFSFVNFVIQPFKTAYYTISAVKTQPFSEQRLSLYERALTASPTGRDQIREFFANAIVPFIRQPDLAQKVPEANILREFDFLAQEMEKSAERNPLNFRIFLRLGELYNHYFIFDSSKLADAERALEKAIELSPTNQQGYWHLAQVRLYQGKLQEALDLAQKAVDLEPRAEKSHLVLIQIAIRIAGYTGDTPLLEEKVRAALEINPEWATSLRELLGVEIDG